jgi:CBS domain-containing protein
MNVGQACTRGAVTVPRSASLAEVAALMCEREVGAVIVTASPLDRPVVVGIITDRDVVRAQLEQTADLARLRAEEVMTPDPLVLNVQQSLGDAISRLQVRGVRRAPVIDLNGALVGLVSTDDLLAQVAGELFDLASLVTRQPRAAAH